MKTIVALAVAALLATLSTTALASGFYLPWWGEALMFLMLTPSGWVVLALGIAALVCIVIGVFAMRDLIAVNRRFKK